MQDSRNLPDPLEIYDRIAERKRRTVEIRPEKSRRSAIVLGGLVGAAYGLGTMWVYSRLLPGVPLAHPPFGPYGNLLAYAAVGTLAVGVCVRTRNAYFGTALANGVMLAAAVGRAYLIGYTPLSAFMAFAFGVFALLMVIVLALAGTPYFLLARAASEAQGEYWNLPIWAWRRARLLLPLLLIAAGLGAVAIPTNSLLDAYRRMDRLVLQGRGSPGSLPKPLADPSRVENFALHAGQPYTLEYSPDEALRSELANVVAPLDVAVVARFADGWRLACLFKDGIQIVLCRSYPAGDATPGIRIQGI